MAEDSSLQERLAQHAKAFDGLLSLIPAKMYYGEDATDQWQRKKQTKEEAKEARRNKLDPNSELNKSVKEVMDEEARKKRKREEQPDAADDDDWSDIDGVEAEKPRQGMKQKMSKKQKKIAEEEEAAAEVERKKEEKKQGKKDRKAERAALREEEAEFNRRTIKGVNKIKLGPRETRTAASETGTDVNAVPSQSIEQDEPGAEESDDMEQIDVADMEADEQDESASQSTPRSPVFDAAAADQTTSTSTSISSTVDPSDKPKHIKIPQDSAALRARLAAKIQSLREARNADRNGKPIRTRQELIEARRSKQEERKAHKKELRRKAKDEADKLREEALASARNSPGGLMSPSVDLEENNFSFGRIAFGDGAQLSHDLSHVLSTNKKKGPTDAKMALQKLETQKKRVQAMDDEKRKDVEDKELWLTAKRRAEGEKVRDDEKMLKKAIKRKDHAKKKSDKEWKDRKEGVAKSIHDRQKKREENLQKKRDEKKAHKMGGKKKSRTGPKKTGGRAGFEGAFKVGGKGKK